MKGRHHTEATKLLISQKAKEAFEKHLTERKLDIRNFHAAYDNILEALTGKEILRFDDEIQNRTRFNGGSKSPRR